MSIEREKERERERDAVGDGNLNKFEHKRFVLSQMTLSV